ncbi:hypothetical protein GOODEAATRI_019315 [Goodea atripinnis]|uniref:Exophilin 5 n=1 Tax=Goodea atripinnis TaxID=208336 RepID=A0ABV0P659_9TELE
MTFLNFFRIYCHLFLFLWKRCHQIQTEDNFTSRNNSCQKQVTERERSFPGQKYNHSFNSSYNSRQHCKGQNDQTEDHCNMKKEIHQGKKIKKKYQQRHNRGAKPVSKTQALKQEKYFYELANKNKEESSEQQANNEETKPAEEQKNPDLLTQPLSGQTAFYAQQVISEKIKVPFRKGKPPPNICVVDNGSKETMPKNLLSPEEKDGLNSDSVPVLSHTSEEALEEQKTHTKQELLYPERSASSRSREIKRSPAGTKCHEGSACPPKHPTQLKPNLFKGRVAVPVEPVSTCNKRRDAATDDASTLTNGVAPGSDSSTAAMKPQQSEDVRIPSLPFFSLFGAPLSENPPRFPCSETETADSAAPLCKPQSAENAASNSKQRDSDQRFFPSQVRTSHRQMSSESFQSSKTENDALKQPSATVCNTASGSPCDPSSSRTHQNLPDVSSSRGKREKPAHPGHFRCIS